ncbi:HEAT repeat domain-containing protein [Streptomyces sp. NBC_00124]|uniref:HEAT repeat domain-containing protein n=1 Tax=Streptomyces sp. NBC_00124 TaxID=2975662 RepID=UPI00225818A3|nr:HEAT repeat domain-containing protein [Streptomyces sp. NBC_00124]MCX5359411.1 HEAT repeat domain-containing protein [Streptomyces sp. NBC_00124]
MFRTFTERRARKEQERQRELSVRLRSPEPEVRAAAAGEIAQARDMAWAIRELAQAMDREPSPIWFDAVAGPFCDAVCRDRAVQERVERMFAAHADAPVELVRAWTALLAEFGAGAALDTVDDELAAEVGARLRRVREQGGQPDELSGTDPESLTYVVTFGVTVELLHDAVRRYVPLPADDIERTRRETRENLERALAHPARSDDRHALLVSHCELPDDETWADRQLAAVRIREALDLCGSAEPDRVALGVQALAVMLQLNHVCLNDAVRETLDSLCVPDQDPFTFSEVLSCYPSLHAGRRLPDPPVELFLAALGHADPLVRAHAAAGLDTIAPGQPAESRAVAALIEAMEHDPDIEVVRSAAYALATIPCSAEADTRAASAALAGKAGSADPGLRVASVDGAIHRDEPGAFDLLTAELRRTDVEARFVSSVDLFLDLGKLPPKEVTAQWARLLERLRQDGWPDRPNEHEDGDDTQPGFRMALLQLTLDKLRAHN